jgi:chromosome partitioning protein
MIMEDLHMKNGIVISVINQKGGVLKTTTVLHLGSALARMGKKVLLIDLDISQANLTISTIGQLDDEGRGILHAFFKDNTLNQVTYPTTQENLFIVPSEITYKGRTIPLDVALASQPGSDQILKKLIKPVMSEYDFVIIDNGPTLGIATLNSLIASEYFLIPTLADYLSLVGVQKTMETIEQVRENLDHQIENLGLVLTMIDGRESIAKDSEAILNNAFEGKVFNTCIQRNSKFKELAQNQTTIFDVTKNSDKGNKNYRELAEEVMTRLGLGSDIKNFIKTTKMKNTEISVGGAQ